LVERRESRLIGLVAVYKLVGILVKLPVDSIEARFASFLRMAY
jgi:hypothetical protein